MKKTTFIFLLSIISTWLGAQDIQWASGVIDVSSEHALKDKVAEKSLGEPNGISISSPLSNAWSPEPAEKTAFIVVEFENPVITNRIVLVGNVEDISALATYDEAMNEYDVVIQDSQKAAGKALEVLIDQPSFEVKALRLSFTLSDSSALSLDAIGLTNSDEFNFQSVIGSDLIDEQQYEIHRLPESVNSTFIEHNPILSLDGKTLYFSRQYDPGNVGGVEDQEDIWFSQWDEAAQNWGPAKNVGGPLNNDGPNFLCSIGGINGIEVAILGNEYSKSGKMKEGVSIAFKSGHAFGEPMPLEIDNYYNYSDKVDFFLAHDGSSILMATEREDSKGERDLYVSFPNPQTGSWTEPKWLGENLNTFEDEESPFLAHDGKTLYFSSKGFVGYGGVDIYKSIRMDDSWTNWSEPLNLGPIINGPGDDEYLTLSPEEEHLYFTKSEANGDHDIFDVNPELTVRLIGQVVDSLSGQKLDKADVLIESQGGAYFYARTDANGRFETEVSANSKLSLTTVKNGYRGYKALPIQIADKTVELADPILLTRHQASAEIVIETDASILELGEIVTAQDNSEKMKSSLSFTDELDQMNPGDSLITQSIYFDLNSSYLRSADTYDLLEFASFMIEHIDLEVHLYAHADSRESNKYNQWISDRRARRIADLLIEYGIEPDRITYKGYGESQLLNDCANNVDCEEGKHQENRRAQIVVYKTAIRS